MRSQQANRRQKDLDGCQYLSTIDDVIDMATQLGHLSQLVRKLFKPAAILLKPAAKLRTLHGNSAG